MLPLSIATRDAFENAMVLDMAMGGSTNTILHLLAAAHEAGVDFGLQRDRRAVAPRALHLQGRPGHRQVPHRGRATAPAASPPSSASWTAPGCSTATSHTVHGESLGEYIDDVRHPLRRRAAEARGAVPRGARRRPHHRRPFSQSDPLGVAGPGPRDGCIRDVEHAYTTDGGLAVLYGNLAPDGAVVKTAGVDEELWTFTGPAVVFESQEDAVEGILGKRSSPATSW